MSSVLLINEVVDTPGLVDGIDDYTALLCNALRAEGVNAEQMRFSRWDARSMTEARRQIRSERFDIAHVQLPSYGMSLTLELFALTQRTVVTFHEWTRLPFYLKFKAAPALVRASGAVFTNESERLAAKKWLHSARRSHEVIPIASNIPVVAGVTRASASVVSFGIIRPNRRWEEFFESARVAVGGYGRDGLPIVTTEGSHVSPELRQCVATCRSPGDAVRVVRQLMEDEDEPLRLANAGRAYVANRTWPRIAEAHIALYQRILGRD